jgi:cytochrome c oxidase subunit 2
VALEQRIGVAELGEDFVVGHHWDRAIKPLRQLFQVPLEGLQSLAYRAAKSTGRDPRVLGPKRMPTGVKMRLIGWAIALAAAGLTPAAAQAQASSPPPAEAAHDHAAMAMPAAGTAQNPDKPDAAQAETVVPGSVGHMIPTPGVGEPDGRKGIQMQVTPIGEEAASFHNNWLLPLCAVISVLVLVLLVWAIVKFRRGANPTPSRNSHNTVIEVIWTLVPVLVLVAIAIPSIRLLRHQYTPPPADVTVKVTGHQWYWSYELPDYGVTFDSYMLKEKNDPTRQANQRARTDADGPPLLAVDNRLVVPAGKVVKFIVTADDVIHSFAVPAFWIKQDANPGQLHETWAKIDRPGVYFGQCSELCGARHGFMPIAVEAVSPAQFASWVASKGGHMPGAQPAATPAAAQTGGGVSTPAPAVAGTSGATPVTNQSATAQN